MVAPHLSSTLVLAEGGFSPFAEFTPGVIFWTLLIFVLSLPLMIKFVFGPIVKNLDERDRKVEEAAQMAEAAKEAAQKAVADAELARQEAMAEARQAKEAAMARVEREVAEERAAAKAELDREREKVRSEIDAAKRKALMEIRQEVVGLTISSTSKLLQKDVDDDAHRRMVTDFIGKN